MKTIRDIAYGGHPSQRLDVHLPDREAFPVFLYFHGGGLEAGDKSDQAALFSHLTQNGIAAVSANYRMYPEAKYPEFIRDAAAAAAWCLENIGQYGGTDVFLGGSSAGGFLSMMLCFDRRWLDKHGVLPTQFAGFVHDAGQPTCHFNVLRERGVDSRRVIIDDSAPLYHIGADETYPPMLLIVSDGDMENRYEQTLLVQSTLKHFGHGAPGVQLKVMHGGHCEYVDKLDPGGTSIFGRIVADFIK